MKIITYLFLLLSAISYSQTIGVTQFATGFNDPVAIVNAGDDRLFIVQQSGQIRILNPDGTINATNFLTLGTDIISVGSERGLLGLAFHPDYADNGVFYINYTRAGDGATVVSRYNVSTDPNVANAASGFPILTVLQPFSNHNGGTIGFGPEGYLYIGMGDGGSGGDPGDRAQDINENLGKMLRIDVDPTGTYTIPPDNPFAGTVTGSDEIWALGLRNPWKWSFDRLTTDLWIADVGQGTVEEINHVSSTEAGVNYGWRCYEGSLSFNTDGCGATENYTFPVAEYTHDETDGCSVTGGYVYRGALYPNFYGKYFFADFCVNRIGMYTEGVGITYSANFPAVGNVTSFGEDINGELYFTSINDGRIFKLIDTSLGTSDFAENGLSLFPNPATDMITILQSGTSPLKNFKLYDVSGKLLMDRKISAGQSMQFDVSMLASGIYVITVDDHSGNAFSAKLSVN